MRLALIGCDPLEAGIWISIKNVNLSELSSMAVARTPIESESAKLELPVVVAVSQVKAFPPGVLQSPHGPGHVGAD